MATSTGQPKWRSAYALFVQALPAPPHRLTPAPRQLFVDSGTRSENNWSTRSCNDEHLHLHILFRSPLNLSNAFHEFQFISHYVTFRLWRWMNAVVTVALSQCLFIFNVVCMYHLTRTLRCVVSNHFCGLVLFEYIIYVIWSLCQTNKCLFKFLFFW